MKKLAMTTTRSLISKDGPLLSAPFCHNMSETGCSLSNIAVPGSLDGFEAHFTLEDDLGFLRHQRVLGSSNTVSNELIESVGLESWSNG